MDEQMRRLARESVERMLDVSVPGDLAGLFIRTAVDAALSGTREAATEREMCRTLYNRHVSAAVKALRQDATRVRQTYLPRHYDQVGFRDEVRIEFPDPRRRPAGEPPYLPVFKWAFGPRVCQEYDRQHPEMALASYGPRGFTPLDPCTATGRALLPIRGWLVRRRQNYSSHHRHKPNFFANELPEPAIHDSIIGISACSFRSWARTHRAVSSRPYAILGRNDRADS